MKHCAWWYGSSDNMAAHDAAVRNSMDDETRKQMNVEETFAALDRIIGKLEKGDGSLEDAFADYEEGMKLVKSCNEKIETIEKKILVLSGDQTEETENGGQF